MGIFKGNYNKQCQFYLVPIKICSGILSLFFMLLFSNFAHANCIDESGLAPVQIKTAVNNKQAQILKKITSKQSAKKAMSKLKECKKQKLKLESIVDGDIMIWARTEAKGDKNKEQVFQQQFKLLNKSFFKIIKQLLRLEKEFPEIENFIGNVLVKKSEVKHSVKKLLGQWYFLEQQSSSNKLKIISEFHFLDKEFAIIDPYLVNKWGMTYQRRKSPGALELVKWNILETKNTVPFSMSMGMSNDELKNYVYYAIELKFINGKPEKFKTHKGVKTRYLTDKVRIHILLNLKKGKMLLHNNFTKEYRATHISDQPFFRKKVLLAETKETMKRWSYSKKDELVENKKRVSKLCTTWKKESIKIHTVRK